MRCIDEPWPFLRCWHDAKFVRAVAHGMRQVQVHEDELARNCIRLVDGCDPLHHELELAAHEDPLFRKRLNAPAVTVHVDVHREALLGHLVSVVKVLLIDGLLCVNELETVFTGLREDERHHDGNVDTPFVRVAPEDGLVDYGCGFRLRLLVHFGLLSRTYFHQAPRSQVYI